MPFQRKELKENSIDKILKEAKNPIASDKISPCSTAPKLPSSNDLD